jgi:hypothetical protein
VPLGFEPGTSCTQFHLNTHTLETYAPVVVYGWSSDVLGFLIEKVSGQSLEQFW